MQLAPLLFIRPGVHCSFEPLDYMDGGIVGSLDRETKKVQIFTRIVDVSFRFERVQTSQLIGTVEMDLDIDRLRESLGLRDITRNERTVRDFERGSADRAQELELLSDLLRVDILNLSERVIVTGLAVSRAALGEQLLTEDDKVSRLYCFSEEGSPEKLRELTGSLRLPNSRLESVLATAEIEGSFAEDSACLAVFRWVPSLPGSQPLSEKSPAVTISFFDGPSLWWAEKNVLNHSAYLEERTVKAAFTCFEEGSDLTTVFFNPVALVEMERRAFLAFDASSLGSYKCLPLGDRYRKICFIRPADVVSLIGSLIESHYKKVTQDFLRSLEPYGNLATEEHSGSEITFEAPSLERLCRCSTLTLNLKKDTKGIEHNHFFEIVKLLAQKCGAIVSDFDVSADGEGVFRFTFAGMGEHVQTENYEIPGIKTVSLQAEREIVVTVFVRFRM